MVAAAPDGTVFYYLDLLYPVVPSAETSEGDTWPISFETSPPAADGTASYTGTGELIGFDDLQGVRTAVVRNELTFRYDFVVSAPEVADLSGLGSIRAGRVRVDGTGTLTLTAWIDPRTGRMLRATTHGSYDIGYVYEDFEPAFPGGTFSVQGSFGYELTAD
jgi:hypothetical protein